VEEIHYPGGCLFIVVTRPGTRIEWLLEQMVPGNFPEDRGNEALAIVDQLREIEAKSGGKEIAG
jgi:hypothetical protein